MAGRLVASTLCYYHDDWLEYRKMVTTGQLLGKIPLFPYHSAFQNDECLKNAARVIDPDRTLPTYPSVSWKFSVRQMVKKIL